MASIHGNPSPLLEQNQQLKQSISQRLIMSAHMQQAIHLLQIPLVEIESFIEEQITQNPILEVFDESCNKSEESLDNSEDNSQTLNEKDIVIDDKDFTILRQLDEEYEDFFSEGDSISSRRSLEEDKLKSYQESTVIAESTLYEHLTKEVYDSFQEPEDIEAALILIGYLDRSGFINAPLSEIALLHDLSEERLAKVLKEIQTFDPYGVGALSIQESLLIQLRCLKKETTLAYTIIEQYYDELLHNRIPIIQKKMKCSFEEIQRAIEHDIASLDLHPGARYSSRNVQALVPDVSLRQENDALIVDVNRDYVPNLRLNKKYLKILDDPETPIETKNFLRKHIFSAKWLMRNLQQRYSTVERIAASLVKRQYEYLIKPEGKLLPLTMKALAEELNLHESTIARTVSNKYINTPRGLLLLRSFFTAEYVSDQGESLSSNTIQNVILDIINNEDKHSPISDERISVILKERGMPCARRTVAKHRANMGFGNTQQRRKF